MELENLVTFKHSPEAAKAVISPACENTGRLPALDEIKDLFRRQGVVHGFDDHVLAEALSQRCFSREIVVAKATSPVNGQDARIQILVAPDGGAKPRIQEDGKADYKEIGTLVQVKADTVLAVKHPATAGSPGKDVYGKILEALPGRDLELPAGMNTKASADGLSLLAAKAGCLSVQGGRLTVSEAFVIGGGVNFKTGNIRFEGDVEVRGGVAEGFIVEAAGNLKVTGEVDGAVLISRGGDITLEAGVFGKGKALLEAPKGEVRLAFAQACRINCRKLTVGKFLQACEVKTWELDAGAPGCLVSGGTVLCYGTAKVGNIGADGAKTSLSIYYEQEEDFLAEKARLDAKVEELKEQLDVHDKKLRAFKALMAKAGQARIPPKTAEEIKASGEASKQLGRTLHHIQSELAMILSELSKPRPKELVLTVRGDVHGTASLDMFHIKRLLSAADSRKEFTVKPAEGLVSYDCPA